MESSSGGGEAFNNYVRQIRLQEQSEACNIFPYEELVGCNQSAAPPTVQYPNYEWYIYDNSYMECADETV